MTSSQGSMARWWRRGLAAAALVACTGAQAAHTVALADDVDLTVGGDMRLRLEGFERTVISPEMEVYGGAQQWGPAYRYLRVRTRLWGTVAFGESMKLNARLVNRSHHVFSRPGENNDGPGTWEFPDEVILDLMNIQLSNIADSDWSLTLGRQEFPLGSGMVFLEGTPYDQGRTIYFDGLSAVMKKEKDTLKLFAFYNNYKDKFAFIDDQNRRLSRGDIFTTGAYWTHGFKPSLNTDLYYIYANVNDTRPTLGGFDGIERNFPYAGPPPQSDADALIHTAGVRLFGAMHEQVDYSLEYACQDGEYNRSSDLTGDLLDARLTLKAPKGTRFSPSLLLQYTSWSGDDPDSANEFEGWDPLFAGYPIFREELLPILFNGNWTNMDQYRLEARASAGPCWKFAAAYAYLRADYGNLANAAGGGGGDSIGHLVSAFVDYAPTTWLKFAVEVAHFFTNSYWDGGDDSTWARFQTIVEF